MGPVHLPCSEDDLRPGQALGPYELVAPVGSGGMARVWAARVRATGQLVALKMLLAQLAENPSFQEMFLDEARIASRVRHPNVCATFELAEYDGILTLAMEWVDGSSLVRMMRPPHEEADTRVRVPLPHRHAARIIADACAGLHAAHELVDDAGRSLAVVHRDVSPHNVLLTADGHVKLTDFGVAKALGKSHMTIAGQIKGKLGYMSPEQLMGGGVDRRSDVFALGCVLYEATTGYKPFRGDNDPQIMSAIMIGSYEPPGRLVPSYPLELEEIVVGALAHEPDARFPSAEHMRVALEAYLARSGPPIGPLEIARLMHDRCGRELADRAQLLASAAPERYPRAPKLTESAAGVEIERAAPTPRPPGILWFVLPVLLGAGLGLAVLSYVRTAKRHRASAAASAIAEPPPASSARLSAASDGPAASVAPATAERAGDASAVPFVHLSLKPRDAIVEVDGVEQPAGTTELVRPSDGGALTIVVRGPGYEETVVLVDPGTPDDVAVSLVPAAASAPGGSAIRPVKQPIKPAASAAPDTPPEAPPNPYD